MGPIRILILEDNVERREAFRKTYSNNSVITSPNAEQCIHLLNSYDPFDIIFLDHDLGGQQMVESGPGTGYEVAEWLRDHPEKLPQIVVVHSLNPAGRANIYHCLKDLVKTYEYPFAWEKDIIGYK